MANGSFCCLAADFFARRFFEGTFGLGRLEMGLVPKEELTMVLAIVDEDGPAEAMDAKS